MSNLENHKKMFLLSGNPSDFQLNNLKQYPFVVFGKILKKVKIEYSFIKPETNQIYPGYVSLDFSIKQKDNKIENLNQKKQILIEWIKNLFWKETEIFFKKNGKKWTI